MKQPFPIAANGSPGRIAAIGGPARRFKTPRTVVALMLREMTTTYGRSPGGYVWAVLEPIGAIALMSFIFSLVVHKPALGVNFPLFYATGFMPFMMFMVLSSNTAASLRFSRQLLAYPSVTFVDALLARFLLHLLTQVTVFYIVLSGIMVIFDTRTAIDLPAIVLGLAMTAVLALGIGTMNCFLLSIFPVWERAWSILTRPLFLISGALFLYEFTPVEVRRFMWFNPLVHVTGEVRRGFYPSYDAVYVSPVFVFGIGFALTALGLVFLSRFHRVILNET